MDCLREILKILQELDTAVANNASSDEALKKSADTQIVKILEKTAGELQNLLELTQKGGRVISFEELKDILPMRTAEIRGGLRPAGTCQACKRAFLVLKGDCCPHCGEIYRPTTYG